jgi:hypothetical protein
MVTVDEFESQFRRSAKEHFTHEKMTFDRVTFFVDDDFVADQAQSFIKEWLGRDDLIFTIVRISPQKPVSEVIRELKNTEPDLVVSYRLLGHPKEPSHSLGTYIDEVSQVLARPLCLLPNKFGESSQKKPERVLVLSESIVGDSTLVNWGVALVPKTGTLVLADLVDGNAFDNYMDLISKCSFIDTEIARAELADLLIKLASEFESECIEVLRQELPNLNLQQFVGFARTVKDYKALLSQYEVELLLFSGKDHNQTAMSALGYALAVEVTDLPVVLL